jgi:murein DD-endopeptidase MepM/ murein hydrolase activator NlpD
LTDFETFATGGVWPVGISKEHGAPRVSDGYGEVGGEKRNGNGHLGVDIMFRRPTKGEFDRPTETPHFRMPNNVLALSCHRGTVWSVDRDPQGFVVKIDHGFPWLSVYRHLKNPTVTKGQSVGPGHPVGTIGHDPRNSKGINHLHFEVWDTSRGNVNTRAARSIDPAPFLKRWLKVGAEGQKEAAPHSVVSARPGAATMGEASAIGVDIADGGIGKGIIS